MNVMNPTTFLAMQPGEFGLLVIGGLVLVVVIYVVATYNSLVQMRNQVRESWSGIDTELRRRYDLIPNLVETVKGYAAHERETLEKVIQARNTAMAVPSANVAQKAQAENFLTGALRQLFALSEAYPNLKANENFLSLQEELTGTENRIAFARQYYNDSAAIYNTARETFPGNIIAGSFGFAAAEFFATEETAREAPKVKF
jgi:LemA protein